MITSLTEFGIYFSKKEWVFMLGQTENALGLKGLNIVAQVYHELAST